MSLKSVRSWAINHSLIIDFVGVPCENGHDEKFESSERLMLARIGVLFQPFASGAGKDERKLFIRGLGRRLAARFERFLLAHFHFLQGDADCPAGGRLHAKRGVHLKGQSRAGNFLQRALFPKERA